MVMDCQVFWGTEGEEERHERGRQKKRERGKKVQMEVKGGKTQVFGERKEREEVQERGRWRREKQNGGVTCLVRIPQTSFMVVVGKY